MSVSARSEALRGHAAMLLFSAMIAGSFSFGGRIANQIDPVALTILRFCIAIGVIGVVVALRGGVRRADLAAPWRYLVIGGLLGLYFVLMFEGLKTAPPVSTAAVFTLAPIFAAGFGWLLLRQVTTPRMALALTVGGAGALWVIFRGDVQALLALDLGRGEAIFLIGVIAHAAYTPMVRRLNRGESPLVFTLGMMVAALVLLVIYGGGRLWATDLSALPLRVWLVTLYLAVFASATTFVLVQYATLRLPSAKVMAYTYLTPSWVIGWELILGAASPPILIFAGIGLILLALALLLKDES